MMANWGLTEATSSGVVAFGAPVVSNLHQICAGLIERSHAVFHLLLRISLQQDRRIATASLVAMP
jgi:hypothetical protein